MADVPGENSGPFCQSVDRVGVTTASALAAQDVGHFLGETVLYLAVSPVDHLYLVDQSKYWVGGGLFRSRWCGGYVFEKDVL